MFESHGHRNRILEYRGPGLVLSQRVVPVARRVGEPWWVTTTIGLGGLAAICGVLLVVLAVSSATYEWIFR